MEREFGGMLDEGTGKWVFDASLYNTRLKISGSFDHMLACCRLSLLEEYLDTTAANSTSCSPWSKTF